MFHRAITRPETLYCFTLIMTAMSYYVRSFLVFVIMLPLGYVYMFVLQAIFENVEQKKIKGYGEYCLAIAFPAIIAKYGIAIGTSNFPISFVVWFLTPQSVVDESLEYTIAIFGLFLAFLGTVGMYFSVIRYRMLMQFVIMLIPLSLYAKDGDQPHILYLVLLLVTYFYLMIDKRGGIATIPFLEQRGVGIYALVIMIFGSIVPKPTITADREFIENVLSFSSLSDILMNAISVFQTSTNNSGSTNNSSFTLYYADAEENLRLGTQTYSVYDSSDTWTVLEEFDIPTYEFTTSYAPVQIMKVILATAKENEEFAEEWHLDSLLGRDLPEQNIDNMQLLYHYGGSTLVPTPTGLLGVTMPYDANVSVSLSRHVSTEKISNGAKVNIEYYSESIVEDEVVYTYLSQMSADSYVNLLCCAITNCTDSEGVAILEYALEEATMAYAYYDAVAKLDFSSSYIDDLAERITANCESDYEKALAIESYFTEECFLYDDSYEKASGENAETFLRDSQTGVCYEFATAMVLLCRSVGLPARLAEGFYLCEGYSTVIDGEEWNYVIKGRNAHAFPEIYIAGYGWLSFEPTVASNDDGSMEVTTTLSFAGWIVVGIVVIALLILFLLPVIRERKFRKALAIANTFTQAQQIFERERELLLHSRAYTVGNCELRSEEFYKGELFTELDRILYGAEETTIDLSTEYQAWYTAYRTYLRALRHEARRNRHAEKRRKKA